MPRIFRTDDGSIYGTPAGTVSQAAAVIPNTQVAQAAQNAANGRGQQQTPITRVAVAVAGNPALRQQGRNPMRRVIWW
jgi:hypothetical protein